MPRYPYMTPDPGPTPEQRLDAERLRQERQEELVATYGRFPRDPLVQHGPGRDEQRRAITDTLLHQEKMEIAANDGIVGAMTALDKDNVRITRMRCAHAFLDCAQKIREQLGCNSQVRRLTDEANRLIARHPVPPRRRRMTVRNVVDLLLTYQCEPYKYSGDLPEDPFTAATPPPPPGIEQRTLKTWFVATDNPYPEVEWPLCENPVDVYIDPLTQQTRTNRFHRHKIRRLFQRTARHAQSTLQSAAAPVATIAGAILLCLFLQPPPVGDVPHASMAHAPLPAAKASQDKKAPAPPEVLFHEQDRPWLGDQPSLPGRQAPLARGKRREEQRVGDESNRRRAALPRGPSLVVTTAANIQVGQTLSYDITGFGVHGAGKIGLVSGPVAATNFDLPEPDSALRPSLDWKGPASTPNPVSSPFDNFVYSVLTPEESLVYHYNAVHELTDIQSALFAGGGGQPYSELFDYDAAGALIARTIFNPSSKSRMPIPGDLGNLPTERYTYERDPLGRVRTGSRELANLNGGFDGEALSAFTYYADSYKVRSRGVRQSAFESFQYSQPVYAGANEIADVSLPPDPNSTGSARAGGQNGFKLSDSRVNRWPLALTG